MALRTRRIRSRPDRMRPRRASVLLCFCDEFMNNAGLAKDTVFGKGRWPAATAPARWRRPRYW